MIGKFVTALGAGDEQQLRKVLAPDDGGGKARSIINPLHGPDRIIRFLLGLYKKYPGEFSSQLVDVNGVVFAGIAKILFVVFVVLFLASLVIHLGRRV